MKYNKDNNLILALGPMAGFTDAPFRGICSQLGANSTVTEMVSAMGLLHSPKDGGAYNQLLYVNKNENNCSAQIFGSDPEICAKAAAIIADMGLFSFIDINMGCPVKKIVNNGEGSALMKTPKLAGEIVEFVSKAVNIPVSVKMRIGWDNNSKNAVDFAKVLENSGAKLLCVHGRTREQFYSGNADWDTIAKVKANVKIPVVANGDVKNHTDALNILKNTNCDGIMIARGSLGNPWIFKQVIQAINGETVFMPSLDERRTMAINHMNALVEFKGEQRGLSESKSQFCHYFFGLEGASQARKDLNVAKTVKEVESILNGVFKVY